MSNLIILLFFSAIVLLAGCPKRQPKEPAFNVQGMKTTIKRVQVSPIAFAGAKIVVLGYITDISYTEEITEETGVTDTGEEVIDEDEVQNDNILILSDSNGNTINVQFEELVGIAVADTVVVSGNYDNGRNTIVSDEIIRVVIDKNGIRPYKETEINIKE